MKCFIGLDVHKSVVEICAIDRAGSVLFRSRIPCTRLQLIRFTKELSTEDELALEVTTNAWAVADLLQPFIGKVVVGNPMKTKAIAEAKVKTDKVDAEVLAQLLRCDYLPSVWIPDEATREMRQLTSRRERLVSERTRLLNRVQSVLASLLIEVPVNTLFTNEGLTWLEKYNLPELQRELVDSDLRLIQATNIEVDHVEKLLREQAWKTARAKLLMTIPGVDYCTAVALLAALGDITRFKDGDHAASYLGITPSVKQSANSCVYGSITKRGNSNARWMLTQAAQNMARNPGPLGVAFRSLAKRKCWNIAVCATARKLVSIIYLMLKNNEPYRYAVPATTERKLSRLRVAVTGKQRKPKHKGRRPGLKNWNRSDGNQDQAWILSDVGDWNSFTEGEATVTYTHNDVHEVTAVGGNSLTYDVKGNLTTNANGHFYTWTRDNQLLTANGVSYEYDALGRRVSKTVGGSTTVYTYDGHRVVSEYSLGASPSAPSEKFIFGSYLDGVTAKIGTGGTVYYHRNQQYSVTAITNSSGSVVERYAYDSHGELEIKSALGSHRGTTSIANYYTYTGRRFEPETNLYYFRARYYDSALGRFVSRDPLGFVDGMNLYRGYFALNGVDPRGTRLIKPVWMDDFVNPKEWVPFLGGLAGKPGIRLFIQIEDGFVNKHKPSCSIKLIKTQHVGMRTGEVQANVSINYKWLSFQLGAGTRVNFNYLAVPDVVKEENHPTAKCCFSYVNNGKPTTEKYPMTRLSLDIEIHRDWEIGLQTPTGVVSKVKGDLLQERHTKLNGHAAET